VAFDENGPMDMLDRIGEIVEVTETFEPDVVRGGLCTYRFCQHSRQQV
jgi:hypothetical protein